MTSLTRFFSANQAKVSRELPTRIIGTASPSAAKPRFSSINSTSKFPILTTESSNLSRRRMSWKC